MKRGALALALAFALAAALILGASPVRSALIVVANGAGEPQTAPTFQADDFNRCALDLNKWVVSDPVGDLTRSSTGAGTGDSDLVLSITPSSVHDAWVPNTAPFITQQVTGDITMEVKFATGLSSTVTGYGLVAVDASGNFLRFDLLKNSSGMRAFVGLIRNGSASTILNAALPAADVAPVWLRVVKASGTWTYSWSADGNTFSTLSSYTPSPALDEAKAGVFVSNYTSGGAVPAFTAKVD